MEKDKIQTIIRKAQARIEKGEIWSAKEILRGNIAFHNDKELYEIYGKLLLDLGEKCEAGKYLFLSSKRNVEYQCAINLFLSRYRKAGWRSLISSFPVIARVYALENLKEPLYSELKEWGLPEKHEVNYKAPPLLTETAKELMTRIVVTCLILWLLIRICAGFETKSCCILLSYKEIRHLFRDSKATLGFIALVSIPEYICRWLLRLYY
jgi:hypothetical protein